MTLVKYRFMLDYEKEERWINEMSARGWHLKKFCLGRFVFEREEQVEYIYRNEYIIDLKKVEKEEYKSLLKDSGAEIVHESFGWIYVRKLASEGPFEIFSDSASKITYYNKVQNIMMTLFGINIFMFFLNVILFSQHDPFNGLNFTVGIINAIVALVLLIPIKHIKQSKKKLEREQLFYE